MYCLDGIIPHEKQPEQESYSYQGIKVVLLTLVGNQCKSIALTRDTLFVDLAILVIMPTKLILT